MKEPPFRRFQPSLSVVKADGFSCSTKELNGGTGHGTRSAFLAAWSGSRGEIRTRDQLINSQLRYRCATRE